MKLILHCETKADQSNKPGHKTTIIKLKVAPDDKSPNAKCFNAPPYACEVTVANPIEAIADEFESGAEYDLTITKRVATPVTPTQ